MAEELTAALVRRAERGTPRGAGAVLAEAQRQVTDGVGPRRSWRTGPVFALAVATVTIVVGGILLLATGLLVSEAPPVATAPPSSTLPPTTAPTSVRAVGAADEILDLALAPDGRLWAATAAGVVVWDLETKSPTVFSEVDGLGGRTVSHIEVGTDGTVWATGDTWLARYDGTWMVIDTVADLPGHIADLAVGPDEVVWIFTDVGTLIRVDGAESTSHLAPLSEPMHHDVWIAVDPNGTVWLSTSPPDRVLTFDGQRWFDADSGLPSANVGTIAVAADGTVWVGDAGSNRSRGPLGPATGILRHRAGEWTVFTTADGLLSNSGSVVVEPSGEVWVVHDSPRDAASEEAGDSTPTGMSRFDGTAWHSYWIESGSGDGAVASDGHLWLPSSEGIVGFDGTETTWLIVGRDPAVGRLPPGTETVSEPVLTLTDDGGLSAAAWSPDGTLLATGSMTIVTSPDAEWSQDTVRIWDAGSGDELFSFQQVDAPVTAIEFSPDSTRLAVRGLGDAVYDVTSGEELGPLYEFLAFSPDGSRAAVGGAWGSNAVVDTATGEYTLELPLCPGPYSWVWDADWNPTGTRLATTCGTSVRVWDAATGDLLFTIGDDVSIMDVAWSPDGSRIATAGRDSTLVKLWDVTSGEEVLTLVAPSADSAGVEAVAWSPDGAQLATGGDDGTARVWDATSGRLLAVFTGHAGPANDVAWSPDGSHLATAGDDGTLKIWNVG